MMLELNQVYHMDCFDLLAQCDDQSIDAIICDLPYGITALKSTWDNVIPLEPMWAAFKRVIKPRGAIVLTASQPFTSALVMSNLEWFKEEIIWDKVIGTGFLDAKRRHMRVHESVLIFRDGQGYFDPQMQAGEPYTRPNRPNTPIYGYFIETPTINETGDRYPKSIITLSNADRTNRFHPTQKPVDLFAYLVRTYTRPGELVLDPTCGSGTTALAARNEGRRFLCGDSDAGYVQIARDRLAAPYTVPMFVEPPPDDKPTQTGFLGDTPK